ncbi:amino acid ABC transporter permease [Oceanobacillus timonensis]|uniref:amino acid ABC transporter permease n=1 Tax=Oceanobacillus timonensis TaxID=1926285 RepID=UPI0009BAE4DE|nr:amino acid ABC transporter permease [Oceanobacillus timonensis]
MFEFDVLVTDFFDILTVVPKTLGLAVIILVLSTLLGGVIALIQRLKVPVLTTLITVVKSFLRGTPMVIMLYLMYYALPAAIQFLLSLVGIEFNPYSLPPVIIVIVTFSVTLSAFQSEIIRGSFQSVSNGQIEAANSLGYSFSQSLRRVIIPQAFVEAVPDFINSYMVILKALSLAFLISVVDIFGQAKIIGAMSFRYLEAFAAAALMYWLICSLLTFLANKYEMRLRRGH